MIEKAGSRVELATWPTTLVLSAPADDSQAAALVCHQTGKVTHLQKENGRWITDIASVDAEMDVVVYRADEPSFSTGPDQWNVTLSGKIFEIARVDRSHAAVILMTLYKRNGRTLAKIAGDGYAFGIEAYARSRSLDRGLFQKNSPPSQPEQRSPWGGRQGRHIEGQGSGVSVAPGLVITNHHVICDVEHLVITHEGRRSDAHIVMSDQEHDISLVRHDLQGLSAIAQRDPAESHLGEEVMAAGFPLAQILGDDLKLTYGDVSGLRGSGDVTRIQFTAPIASGSSGGALVDMSGRLVGIVSAALRHSAFTDRGAISENVNFAVKASLVREMMVAAGCPVPSYSTALPLSRATLAQMIRKSVVSINCYRS